MAVPYVTEALLDLRAGDTLAVDLSPATLAGGQTNPTVLRRYLKAGVALHRSPGLHAKVFVLGDTAVVGSSNMSTASAKELREAVLVVRDRGTVQAVAHAAHRLLGAEVTDADLDDAAKLYRPPTRRPKVPKRPSKEHPAGQPPTSTDRLWIIGLYEDEWPATATKRASAVQPTVRRRAGKAADVEIGVALFDRDSVPAVRVDDMVIEAWGDGPDGALSEAMYPARVSEIVEVPGPGRSNGWTLVYWRRPAGTESRTWSDVQATARQNGARFGGSTAFMRRIKDPALRMALLALWSRKSPL